jgi:hypothetical protein
MLVIVASLQPAVTIATRPGALGLGPGHQGAREVGEAALHAQSLEVVGVLGINGVEVGIPRRGLITQGVQMDLAGAQQADLATKHYCRITGEAFDGYTLHVPSLRQGAVWCRQACPHVALMGRQAEAHTSFAAHGCLSRSGWAHAHRITPSSPASLQHVQR